MCAVAVNCCPKPVPMDIEGGATCMDETVGWPDELEPAPPAHPVSVAMSSNRPAHNVFFMPSPVNSFFSGDYFGEFSNNPSRVRSGKVSIPEGKTLPW